MFNFLRMDFYRMVHSKTTWIFVGIIAISCIFITGVMGYLSSDAFKELYLAAQAGAGNGDLSVIMGSPSFGVTAITSSDLADANLVMMMTGGTIPAFLGGIFINGGALSTLVMLYVALFFASEFDSGFAKNIFTTRTNRVAFFASKAVFMLAVAVGFSAFAFGLLYLGSLVIGLDLQGAPLGDFALWCALVVLVLFTLAMIVAFVTWLIRNKVAGILVAVFVGANVVYQLVTLICQLIPALNEVPNYLLSGCLASLGSATEGTGNLDALHILGVAVVFLVVFSIGSIVSLKKKDI